MDLTLTHTRFGRSSKHPIGQLTHTRRSDGAPETGGVLKTVVRVKIIHYRQLYLNRPDPIAFMPVTVDTSGCIYDDFSRLLFLHAHREVSDLTNELPEESDQFRFLHVACLANLNFKFALQNLILKGSLDLILAKASAHTITSFYSFQCRVPGTNKTR
jgi:hypothetical protein